jgi:hypothetical protein
MAPSSYLAMAAFTVNTVPRRSRKSTYGLPPGLTHEALLILSRRFWFSGSRVSSQEKKRDRCHFNLRLNIFSSNKSQAIINAAEDHASSSKNAFL